MNGSHHDGGGGGGGGEGAAGGKRKRVMIELEPIPYDAVERIHPDGQMVLLPPQTPEDIFARKVAHMRAQQQQREKEAEEAEGGGAGARAGVGKGQEEFAWKETVDNVRAAAHHARQLSLLLDLVGQRNTVLCPTSSTVSFPLASTLLAKAEAVAAARGFLASAANRLQVELRLDTVFLQGLSELREHWNIRPIKRSPLSSHAATGPAGALGVHLGLQSAGSSQHYDDSDAIILRGVDGSLSVRVGPDFLFRHVEWGADPDRVAVATDGVSPGKAAAVPPAADASGGPLGRDRYLLRCLQSLLAHDLFRVLAREASEAGKRQGVHAGKNAVAYGAVAARLHARKQSEEGQEGGGEGGKGGVEVGGGGVVLGIAARQLLRAEHRIRRRNKPGQGGTVPRQPRYPAALGSTGILPALDAVSAHAILRGEVLKALEGTLSHAFRGSPLSCATLHRPRSEVATVSRFVISARNPPAGGALDAPGGVQVDVCVRGAECTVMVTPSVVAPGRGCDLAHAGDAAAVGLHVRSTLAVLAMRAVQREAASLGFAGELSHGATGEDACRCALALRPGGGGDPVSLVLDAGGEGNQRLLAFRGGLGGLLDDLPSGGVDWEGVKGRTWRDKLRRVLLGQALK